MREMSDSMPVVLISYIDIKATRSMSGMLWLRKVAINDSSDDNSGDDMIMMMMIVMKVIMMIIVMMI